MKYSEQSLWSFLKRNGLVKIKRKEDEFFFLIDHHRFPSTIQTTQITKPLHFFRFIRAKLEIERPKSRKILPYSIIPPGKIYNGKKVTVDKSTAPYTYLIYKKNGDSIKDKKIIGKLIVVRSYLRDCMEQLNNIKFNLKILPPELDADFILNTIVASNSNNTSMGLRSWNASKKEWSIWVCDQFIEDQKKEFIDRVYESLPDANRKLFLQFEFPGKRTWSVEQAYYNVKKRWGLLGTNREKMLLT